jgi:LacI family transcriptional regulator, galactose operon repressor
MRVARDRPPTMRDVALRAGVGVGTVSRVVNGGKSVRPQTAARVQAAIDELAFRRNDIARALRPGMNSRMIALLLGDLTNPFYGAIAKTAVDVARAADYAVVVTMVDEDPLAEQRVVHDLLGRRMAGLMIVPDQGDHAFLQGTYDNGTPIVFVDRPATGIDADVVLLDNDRGGFLATSHLLEHRHRRIAALVAPSYYTTGQRIRGYRRALRTAGVEVDTTLIVSLPEGSPEAAHAATLELMRRRNPPTAIFATTNFLCEGALRAVGAVHRPVAVVGFDDFRLADLLPLPATVVAGDVEEMGRRAAVRLLDRIMGDTSPPHRDVLPVDLHVRGSGEVTASARAAR